MDLQSHLVERYAKVLVDLSEEKKKKLQVVCTNLLRFVNKSDQEGTRRMLEALANGEHVETPEVPL